MQEVKLSDRGAIVVILSVLQICISVIFGAIVQAANITPNLAKIGSFTNNASVNMNWILLAVIFVITMAILGAAVLFSDDELIIDGKPFGLKRVVLGILLVVVIAVNYLATNLPVSDGGCTGSSIFTVGNFLLLWVIASMYANASPVNVVKAAWQIWLKIWEKV